MSFENVIWYKWVVDYRVKIKKKKKKKTHTHGTIYNQFFWWRDGWCINRQVIYKAFTRCKYMAMHFFKKNWINHSAFVDNAGEVWHVKTQSAFQLAINVEMLTEVKINDVVGLEKAPTIKCESPGSKGSIKIDVPHPCLYNKNYPRIWHGQAWS